MAPRKILVIRLSSLGDILLTTPLIRALKRSIPQCQVDYLVGSRYQDLLKNNPNIDNVILFESGTGIGETLTIAKCLRATDYDLIIDLHGSLRSLLIRFRNHVPKILTLGKHRIRRAMLILLKRNLYPDDRSMALWMLDSGQSLGLEDDGGGLDLFVDSESERKIHRIVDAQLSTSRSGLIALAPGARHFTKQWPLDRWCELAKMLTERSSAGVIVLGGVDDRPLGEEIVKTIGNRGWNSAGQFSLAESAAVLSCCRAVITNDSGILHMAAARQVPVVGIFGPTVRAFGFHPFRVPFRVVERSISCRPCSTKGSSRCPLGHFRCMRDITSEDVWHAYEDLISCQENSVKAI